MLEMLQGQQISSKLFKMQWLDSLQDTGSSGINFVWVHRVLWTTEMAKIKTVHLWGPVYSGTIFNEVIQKGYKLLYKGDMSLSVSFYISVRNQNIFVSTVFILSLNICYGLIAY